MKKNKYGDAMNISKETRRESYENVKPSLRERQKAVLRILREHGDLSAQEIAAILQTEGITPTDERNFSAPRLTELCEMGLVTAVGKKVCGKTGRTVTIRSAKGKAKCRKPEPADNSPPLQIELSLQVWLDSLERGGGKAKQHINRKERRGATAPPLFD